MPDGEGTQYPFPGMSGSEFSQRVEAYLWDLFDLGRLVNLQNGNAITKESDAKKYIGNMSNSARFNPTPTHPYYPLVMQYTLTPQYLSEQAASVNEENFSQWLSRQNLSLAQQKEARANWEWQQEFNAQQQQMASQLGTQNAANEMQRRNLLENQLARSQQANLERAMLRSQNAPSLTMPEDKEKLLKQAYQMLTSSLAGNVNWIQRSQLDANYQQALNQLEAEKGNEAYSQARIAADESYTAERSALEAADRMEKAYQNFEASKNKGVFDQEIAKKSLDMAKTDFKIAWEHDKTSTQREKMWAEVAAKEYQSQTISQGGGSYTVGAGGEGSSAWNAAHPLVAPNTPTWLAPIIGQKAGTPITSYENFTAGKLPKAAPMPTWATLSPSYQEKLGGYLQAAGQNPADYFALSSKQLPQNPSLGKRWTPTRARI